MKLSPLPTPPAKHMLGPTPWSNWVITSSLIAGAFPASNDDKETEAVLTTLFDVGVTTFVCLQSEVDMSVSEPEWRAGYSLRPYFKDVEKLLAKHKSSVRFRLRDRGQLDFVHLPIVDGGITTDEAMDRLANECCVRVMRGELLYVHCWGGHGRTGTLVAVVLGRLYGLSACEALRLTQVYHDARVCFQGVESPQTPAQRAQVQRVLALPVSRNLHAHMSAARPQQRRKRASRRAADARDSPDGDCGAGRNDAQHAACHAVHNTAHDNDFTDSSDDICL